MNNKLKYLGYSIVFQEIPNEVTLAINISGCPHKCEGCHSQHLWEYKGNYISDDLESLIQKYKDLITCVCFMGGDQNQTELLNLLIKIQRHGLKTALYTGVDFFDNLSTKIISNLNYCKIGHYDNNCGGLNNPKTNQRMFVWDETIYKWKDITYKFWKED